MTNTELVENVKVFQELTAVDTVTDWELAEQIADYCLELDGHVVRYNKAIDVVGYKYAKLAAKNEDKKLTIEQQEDKDAELLALHDTELVYETPMPIISGEIVKELYEDKEIQFGIGSVKMLKKLGMYSKK